MNERLPTVASSPRAIAWALASLAGIVAFHAWGAFHSPTRLWAFDAMRYLSPVVAWATWAVAAAALFPSVTRALAPGMVRLASLRGSPMVVAIALAAWLLDDHMQFIGDFMVRQRAVELGSFMVDFEPSMVGETFLFYHFPRLLAPALGPALALYPRVLGLLELVAFTLLALRLVRYLGFRNHHAAAAALVLVMSGALLSFTGIPKAGREIALLLLAAAVCLYRVSGTGRGMVALSIVVLLAMWIHRSGIFLAPAWVVGLWTWLRSRDARGGSHRLHWVPVTLFAIGLLWVVPPALERLLHYDTRAHFAGTRVLTKQAWIDLFDLWIVLAPAWIVGGPASVARIARGTFSREDAAIWALAIPWLALMLITRPGQGFFRDWDVFAPGAVALTIVGLAGLRHATGSGPRERSLVTSAAVVTAVFTLQWMVLVHDTPRGLARVHAYASEARFLFASTRAQMFDFLGLRAIRLDSWPGVEDAYRRATELVPDRRMELTLATAQIKQGKYAEARSAYRKLLSDHPDDEIAWLGLLGVGLYQGDSLLAKEAGEHIDAYPRDGKEMREIRLYLHYFPDVIPASYRTEVKR